MSQLTERKVAWDALESARKRFFISGGKATPTPARYRLTSEKGAFWRWPSPTPNTATTGQPTSSRPPSRARFGKQRNLPVSSNHPRFSSVAMGPVLLNVGLALLVDVICNAEYLMWYQVQEPDNKRCKRNMQRIEQECPAMAKWIVLLLIFSVLISVGCATKLRQAPDGPLPYQEGYLAGCDSGYVAAGHPYYKWHKDVERFNADKLYSQGWNDGFATCKGKYEATQRMMAR